MGNRGILGGCCTFGHYKFSRFSLGKVIPAAKWKAMTICTIPIVGITMVFYSIMNLFHLDFLPKQMMEISYLGFLPYNIIGSFISAYIFFGAIQEELIRCGKKRWVQLLTLSIMMLPACMMSVTTSGDINVDLTVLGTIFLGGFLVGLYMAMNMPSGTHSQQIEGLEESIDP